MGQFFSIKKFNSTQFSINIVKLLNTVIESINKKMSKYTI